MIVASGKTPHRKLSWDDVAVLEADPHLYEVGRIARRMMEAEDRRDRYWRVRLWRRILGTKKDPPTA